MNEFEIGKEIGQLSNRLVRLERTQRVSTIGEDISLEGQSFDDELIGDEGVFDVQDVRPGACKASAKGTLKNVGVTQEVCAENETKAEAKALKNEKQAVKDFITDKAGLKCKGRSCTGGADCTTTITKVIVRSIGGWKCTPIVGGKCDDRSGPR